MLTYAWIVDPSSCDLQHWSSVTFSRPLTRVECSGQVPKGKSGATRSPPGFPTSFQHQSRNNCPRLVQTYLRCSGFTSLTAPHHGFTGTCFPFSLSVARIREILLCSSTVFLSWLNAQHDTFSRPIFFIGPLTWHADYQLVQQRACGLEISSFVIVFFIILGFRVHNGTWSGFEHWLLSMVKLSQYSKCLLNQGK